MSPAQVKVCCISSLKEAEMALKAGATYLGLVSEMPSGPGVITLDLIHDIVNGLPGETRTILLTSKQTAGQIIRQHKLVKTWGLQLVDKLPEKELLQLRKALPKTRLIQVIHVIDKASIKEALSYANLVDMILLDSGNPHAKVKTLGGTGNTHDWDTSQEICRRSSLPVFLAGGLHPGNIQAAISAVAPVAVDLCSGVRTAGHLDQDKLTDFMIHFKTDPPKQEAHSNEI